MFQTLMLSALIAVGQQPPPAKPKPPSPLESAVTRALQSHPDIRVAEAEVQVAQAKLAQAKLKIAQQVTALHADMDRLKVAVDSTAQTMAMAERLAEKGNVATSELMAARASYAAARANLAKAEAEYNALVGPAPAITFTGRVNDLLLTESLGVAFSADGQFLAVQQPDGSVRVQPATGRVSSFTAPPVVPGSPADKLKAVLDKPVKLPGEKGYTLKAALETVTKAAGLDVRVRPPTREDADHFKDAIRIVLPAGEYSVGTWMQLVMDEAAQREPGEGPPGRPARYEVYVREYGLLVCDPKLAPQGAITVADLWKQAQAEKAKPGKK